MRAAASRSHGRRHRVRHRSRLRWRGIGSTKVVNGCTWSISTVPLPVRRAMPRSFARSVRKRDGIPVQVGGGIRDLATIAGYLDAGMDQVIVGTRAVAEPAFLAEACAAFPTSHSAWARCTRWNARDAWLGSNDERECGCVRTTSCRICRSPASCTPTSAAMAWARDSTSPPRSNSPNMSGLPGHCVGRRSRPRSSARAGARGSGEQRHGAWRDHGACALRRHARPAEGTGGAVGLTGSGQARRRSFSWRTASARSAALLSSVGVSASISMSG